MSARPVQVQAGYEFWFAKAVELLTGIGILVCLIILLTCLCPKIKTMVDLMKDLLASLPAIVTLLTQILAALNTSNSALTTIVPCLEDEFCVTG